MPSDAFEHAKTLLTDLGWEGVAMVEFKRDVRDGTAKLMEINGRFWGSLQLAIDAGVDFPRILIDSTVGQTPAAMPDYRVGVQSRWFWGDVDALLIQLFGAGSTARSIKGGRLTVLRDFLRMWSRDLYYENPKWDDPRPWLNETRHWLWGTP
jgi:predicted ATP-grasp superfamily ATP-dependent carboligase